MAKKVNDVQNGDFKSNVITLRSVFGKVGQKYFIQPQKGKTGRYAPCVKRVDANDDIILTPEELLKESRGEAVYIKENEVFIIEDGKTFNLDDMYEAAVWESIKDCDLIAPDRFAKNENGDYLIDGSVNPFKTKKPRYGSAELYVEYPGLESQRRVTRRKLIVEASNHIMNDERGYEGRLLAAKVLGRNMKNQPNADVEDYLLSIAEKTPEKIIELGRLARTIFGRFITGQCTEATILGTLSIIGMLILKIPYAVPIGVLIGVTALIPIVGAFIGIIIGAILILSVAPAKVLTFIIFILILQQLEGNLIYPKVVGDSVGLPGIWVLVAVAVGGDLFGVVGMLLGVPTASILYKLLKNDVNKKVKSK